MRSKLIRLMRGCQAFLGMLVFPLGRLIPVGSKAVDERRLNAGLTLILTGIEGRSFLNHSIRRGLLDAGVPTAIEIVDWTTGFVLLFPVHLRSRWLRKRRAIQIADRIADYQRRFPNRPVHLIGHSGGCGIALAVIEWLPANVSLETVVFLGAAVSPRVDLAGVVARVRNRFVNYYSPLDFLFLGLATMLLGTMDGRHSVSAGCCGFRVDGGQPAGKVDQRPFKPAMIQQFNFGGHFGWTNRVFVAESIAPLL